MDGDIVKIHRLHLGLCDPGRERLHIAFKRTERPRQGIRIFFDLLEPSNQGTYAGQLAAGFAAILLQHLFKNAFQLLAQGRHGFSVLRDLLGQLIIPIFILIRAGNHYNAAVKRVQRIHQIL